MCQTIIAIYYYRVQCTIVHVELKVLSTNDYVMTMHGIHQSSTKLQLL